MYATRPVFRMILKANSHNTQRVVNKTTIDSFITIQSTDKISEVLLNPITICGVIVKKCMP